MPKLVIDLSPEIHAQFRDYCRAQGITMTAMVTKYGIPYMLTTKIGFPHRWHEAGELPIVQETSGASLPTNRFERSVLSAVARLYQQETSGAWRFSTAEITRESGLYPSEAKKALKELQTRGIMNSVRLPSEDTKRRDPDGNPLMEEWWTITTWIDPAKRPARK